MDEADFEGINRKLSQRLEEACKAGNAWNGGSFVAGPSFLYESHIGDIRGGSKNLLDSISFASRRMSDARGICSDMAGAMLDANHRGMAVIQQGWQLPAPDLRRVISGAVYDFAARLTTLDQPMTVGADHNAAPMAQACEQFLRDRGCSNGEPMVMDWHEHMGAKLGASDYDRHQHVWSEVRSAAMAAGLNYEAADRAARSALESLKKAKVV